MPIYLMHCDSCHAEQDLYRSVAKMDEDLPHCCGEQMRRKICAPYVVADIQPYKSMATGEMITSRSKHKQHLRDHGLVEIGNETPKQKAIEKPRDIKKDLHEVMAGYGL